MTHKLPEFNLYEHLRKCCAARNIPMRVLLSEIIEQELRQVSFAKESVERPRRMNVIWKSGKSVYQCLLASALFFSFFLGGMNQASAQLVVTDPTNIAQSTISAISDASVAAEQFVQIANEFRQIEMLARDLEQFSPQNLADLQDALKQLSQLYDRANQIGMKWDEIGEQFDDVYEGYDPESDGHEGYQTKRKKWKKQTEKSIRVAMISHGALEEHEARDANIESLVSASGSSKGTLAAIQAGNEISGVLAKQMMELTKIIIADSRARLSFLQEQKSLDAASEARSKEKLFEGYGEMQSYDKPPNRLPKIR